MRKIFHNGAIYTSDKQNPFAEAMITDGEIISWLGMEKDLGQPEGEYINLHGKRVLPGFVDAHMHPLLLAENEEKLYCGPPQVTSINDLIKGLAEKAETEASRKEACWIEGWGYDEAKLAEQRSPVKADLDKVSSERPVMIMRACAHVIVVNSAVLKLAEIDRYTESPPGGQIDRDALGEPTGVLRDRAAELVFQKKSLLTEEKKAELLTKLSQKLFSQGITSVTDLLSNTRPHDSYGLYARAFRKGYKQRTVLYYLWEGKEMAEELLGPDKLDSGKNLYIGGLKLFADGSISGKTACLSEPYLNNHHQKGLSITSEHEIKAAAKTAAEKGIQLAIHAMGDQAVDFVTDAFSRIKPWMNGIPSLRIEHASLMSQKSVKKAAEAGIAVVSQPLFLYAEIDSYIKHLGQARTDESYTFRKIMDEGVLLAFSSDAPATSWSDTSNPFTGIQAAVTRQAHNNVLFNKDEKLTVSEAVDLYTSKASAVTGIPYTGLLKPGYYADFTILETDIFAMPPDEISHIKVLETYFSGALVHSSDSIPMNA